MVEFINDVLYGIGKDDICKIERVILLALEAEGFNYNADISVVFVDDNEIRRLNKKYRKNDSITDVLSFPALELKPGVYDNLQYDKSMPLELGDIVISAPRTKKQAAEYGRSFLFELCFLSVHSVLHLLGYDHANDKEYAVMSKKQEQILVKANLTR